MDASNEDLSLTEVGIARFENWYLWAGSGEAALILKHYYPRQVAACALYRPPPNGNSEEDDEAPEIVDADDARRVDAALCLMPAHLKTAVTNHYLGRPRIMNTPRDVLEGWVGQAARMLMERWPLK